MRIVGFAGFMLLVMLPVVDWSLRYYALGALLFLLAGNATVALIYRREDRRQYKAARVIFRAIGMTMLIFALTLPAILFPEYRAVEATGEFQVATATYTYTDTSRVETYTQTGESRKLTVGMWYPDNADGKYPLIVFSHGAFGMRTSNETLYNELASHGYVICSIDHTYQCLYTTDGNGREIWMDRGYMREVSAENALADRQQSHEYYQKWMNIRTGDINFVIEHILAEAEKAEADKAYRLMDKASIGVMGHSLGGSAALGVGRMRDDVDAVIALESPFMCDIQGVSEGEFVFVDEAYPVPVLNIYSDSGWGILASRPQYAENYALLSATDATAFSVHISGVGHLSLTDLALSSPPLTRILNGHTSTTDAVSCLKTINRISLEFFDCYLKGEGQFTSGGTY